MWNDRGSTTSKRREIPPSCRSGTGEDCGHSVSLPLHQMEVGEKIHNNLCAGDGGDGQGWTRTTGSSSPLDLSASSMTCPLLQQRSDEGDGVNSSSSCEMRCVVGATATTGGHDTNDRDNHTSPTKGRGRSGIGGQSSSLSLSRLMNGMVRPFSKEEKPQDCSPEGQEGSGGDGDGGDPRSITVPRNTNPSEYHRRRSDGGGGTTITNIAPTNAATPVPSTQSPAIDISRNVPLILLYTFFSTTSQSLWITSVLSSYVYLIEDDSTTRLGFITAILGLSKLLTALPTGYITDRYRNRNVVFRIGSATGFLAIGMTSYSVYWHTPDYAGLCFALAAWGVHQGMINTCTTSLFADSIADGRRSLYFTRRVMVRQLSLLAGPLVALVMFYGLGNEWTVQQCSDVVLVAQLVAIPGMLVLWLFRDEYTVSSRGGVDDSTVDAEDEEDGEGNLLRTNMNEGGDCARKQVIRGDMDDTSTDPKLVAGLDLALPSSPAKGKGMPITAGDGGGPSTPFSYALTGDAETDMKMLRFLLSEDRDNDKAPVSSSLRQTLLPLHDDGHDELFGERRAMDITRFNPIATHTCTTSMMDEVNAQHGGETSSAIGKERIRCIGTTSLPSMAISGVQDGRTASATSDNIDEGDGADDGSRITQSDAQSICCWFTVRSDERYIAIMVATADLLSGLAAGMSIRYFPIFFLNNLNLQPAEVQVLYVASPILMSLLSYFAQRMSKRMGRCQVTVLYKWSGVFFMILMVHIYDRRRNSPTLASTCIIGALYVCRTALMNSTSGLTKSVLMDSVPRHERGKWSALESVNQFSWSGSAAIGGILVSEKGILYNFHITAMLQVLATLPLIILFRKVPPENKSRTTVTAASL